MYQNQKVFIFYTACMISLCFGNSVLHKVYEESVNIPCETNVDCEFHEECNADYFCQCRSGEHCPNITAVTSFVTTKIGEICHVNGDCNIPDAVCEQTGLVCKCLDGFVTSSNGKSCLTVAHFLADKCVEDHQCNTYIKNSICLQTTCACALGMHDYNNTCHSDRALGDICQTSAECITPYAECQNNKCSCTRRYIASNDNQECFLTANSLLSPCKKNEQCMATLGAGAHCYNNLCNCMYMYQFKASVKQCVRDMTLGDACKTHSDCHQPGSDPSRLICILSECQCQTPMYVQDGTNCIESSGKKLSAVPILIFLVVPLLF